MNFSATLAGQASVSGVGLHGGQACRAVFRPAPPGRGIRFFRVDLNSGPIPALLENVNSTLRGTNLARDGAEVYTVEHILSACAGLGISDLDILLDAPEPPIMDGSALPYVKLLREAGIEVSQVRARALSIDEPVSYRDGDAEYRAEPAEFPEYAFVFKSQHPLARRQEFSFRFSAQDYQDEIAPARTFAFEEELGYLRAQGLAKGGSLDNAVVVGRDGFMSSEGGLRFKDELVRHKVLDMIGDFFLLGALPGRLRISAVCGGHRHNVAFARQLLRQASLKEE